MKRLATIRPIQLDHDVPPGELRRALSVLSDRAEQLEHLGKSLGELCLNTRGDTSAEEMRNAATSVRANAAHALQMAAGAAEIAGRLDTIAAVLESARRRDV